MVVVVVCVRPCPCAWGWAWGFGGRGGGGGGGSHGEAASLPQQSLRHAKPIHSSERGPPQPLPGSFPTFRERRLPLLLQLGMGIKPVARPPALLPRPAARLPHAVAGCRPLQ